MIVNIIGFQICWLGLVYWGNVFVPIAALLLICHLVLLSKKQNEAILIITILLIGSIVDFILVKLGLFIFSPSTGIPLWLMVLWACFAATLRHSLRFLKKSILLQLIIGSLVAPLSYIAGEKLGAVAFPYSLLFTYFILSILWGLLMVLFFQIEDLLFAKEAKNETQM